MTCRERGTLIDELALVGTKRKLTSANLKAVLSGVRAGLRMLRADEIREDIPDRIGELLRQLDEPTQG
jgi:hypothetical protein